MACTVLIFMLVLWPARRGGWTRTGFAESLDRVWKRRKRKRRVFVDGNQGEGVRSVELVFPSSQCTVLLQLFFP